MQHAYNTIDLAPEDRVAVERLLGRPLQNDEAVEFVIHKVDRREQEATGRKTAAARIRELAKGIRTKGGGVECYRA